MAFTQERYDQLIQVLADTATPVQKGMVYSEDIQAFVNLSHRETVALEAAGHPFKVYINTAHHKVENAPLFINIHGGGWYVGHMNNDVYFAAWLAEQIGGVVVDVDYSTSGIAPWNVMYTQCLKAVDYALENARRLGCSPERISIGGYSAGGHITASIVTTLALQGKTPFALDVLCYAPLDMTARELPAPRDEKEANQQRRGSAFTELLMRGDESLRETPTFNPSITPDAALANYPTTLIITAGKCGFRFEDEAYGARLAAQGVETIMKRYPGATHGFIPHFTQHWEEAAGLMVRYIVQARRG